MACLPIPSTSNTGPRTWTWVLSAEICEDLLKELNGEDVDPKKAPKRLMQTTAEKIIALKCLASPSILLFRTDLIS